MHLACFRLDDGFEPGVTHQLQPDFEKSPAFFMPISRIVEFSALIPCIRRRPAAAGAEQNGRGAV